MKLNIEAKKRLQMTLVLGCKVNNESLKSKETQKKIPYQKEMSL